MEVGFYKDVYHEYMVVDKEAQIQADVFEEQLLHNKEIPGLLRMKMEYMGGQCKYYYDIGRMTSMENLKDSKDIDCSLVSQLFSSIRTMLATLDDYLLQPESLWLEPEGIYKMRNEEKFFLAYIPGYEKNFKEQIKELLSWFMKHIDHSQKDTVMFVYGLYKCFSESDNASAVFEKIEDAGHIIEKDGGTKNTGHIGHKPEITGKSPEKQDIQLDRQRETADMQRGMMTFVAEDHMPGKMAEETEERGNFLLYFAVAAALLLVGIILKDIGAYFVYQLTGIYFQTWVIPAVFSGIGLIFCIKGVVIFKGGVHKKSENHDRKEFWQDSQRPDYSMMGQDETSLLKPEMTEDILVLKRMDGDTFERDIIYVTCTPFVIGKQYEYVNYHLSDHVVSRRHLEIRKEGRHFEVIDLSSTNGTWLNGSKIDSGVAYEIKQSDMLKIADIPFSVDLKVRQ